MKQVRLVFGKRGICRILAHGTFGKGTEDFTLNLGKELGTIVERHQGHHHTHEPEPQRHQEEQKQGVI